LIPPTENLVSKEKIETEIAEVENTFTIDQELNESKMSE